MVARRSRFLLVAFLLGIGPSFLSGCGLFHGEVPEGLEFELSRHDEPRRQELLARARELFAEPRSVERVRQAAELYLETVSPLDGFESLWRSAEARAWLAEEHPDEEARLEHARRGAAAAREAVNRAPDRAGGHYYLAILLGLMSQLEGGGLNRIELMLEHGRRVIEIDERFEHAGGHRLLGLLIFETLDNLLVSTGSFDEGLEHLERACELAPAYGLNHLGKARMLIDDEDFAGAREALERVLECPAPEGERRAHETWLVEARELLEEIGKSD